MVAKKRIVVFFPVSGASLGTLSVRTRRQTGLGVRVLLLSSHNPSLVSASAQDISISSRPLAALTQGLPACGHAQAGPSSPRTAFSCALHPDIPSLCALSAEQDSRQASAPLREAQAFSLATLAQAAKIAEGYGLTSLLLLVCSALCFSSHIFRCSLQLSRRLIS